MGDDTYAQELRLVGDDTCPQKLRTDSTDVIHHFQPEMMANGYQRR
ncbi:hypothetical protein [Paenibacillus planticolens]|nr:hypothetical protein [Paenibacillus planticolens]